MSEFKYSTTVECIPDKIQALDVRKNDGRTKAMSVKGLVLVAFVCGMDCQASAKDPAFAYSYNDSECLVGINRQASETMSELFAARAEISSLLDRLDGFAALKEGWNGYDALPIEKESYENAKAAIRQMPVGQAGLWNVFPNTNGTILLTAKGRHLASISIGNTGFSYFAEGADGRVVEDECDFSTSAVAGAFQRINEVISCD